MPIVTLMTDFGLKDGNVGVMKGVIWSYAPKAHIADLSHLIGPQDIREACLILARSAPYFPPGTVHLVVVDPGVGTRRRPIAARLGEHFFVGPDNGLITQYLDWAEQAGLPTSFVHLDRPQFWLPQVSDVFHGRDIFSPIAGRLAAGSDLSELGTPIFDPLRIDLPQPRRTASGWQAEVIHVDHFGNLATNLRREHLDGVRHLTLRMAGVTVEGPVRTFGDRAPGELVTLFGSTGSLIVSEVNGSAARRLRTGVGEPVEVLILD
jgi:S-adenosyl-L-methionine hydrolase (adenosine-forming)